MSSTETVLTGDIKLQDGCEMSEPGNALRLALLARGRIHYVSEWSSWIVYSDGKWERDDNGILMDQLAKMVPLGIFALAETLNGEKDEDYKALHLAWARKSNTEPQFKRMINLARSIPGVLISSAELDAHPWLFNVENGTYDFWNDQFRAHDPNDLLTVQAPVMYDPAARCPSWEGYLSQWQPDQTVQKFLAEITGSGLTGIAVQNLFINVGEGRNGKGTFYKTIQLILGKYAITASEDMLIETKFKAHDEEKAKLRGCRFLVAPETGVGDRLDEAGIKNMTGGDMMHARHLYGRPFDFMPTHTVFLHTNHDPSVRGTDPAIWSRVMMIKWLYTVPFEQRDMHIDEKLKAERSGILNWLIDGAKRFRKQGIRPPKIVMEWTEGYRQKEDKISNFMADCLSAMQIEMNQLGHKDFITNETLRTHYVRWCESQGHRPWSAQSVSKELSRLGWDWVKKRIAPSGNGAVVKVWYESSKHSSEEPLVTDSVSIVSTLPILNHMEVGEEEEERRSKEIVETGNTDGPDDWEPSEEEIEQRHREWLYDHGYPVPPTEEEIEKYFGTYEEDDEVRWRD